MRLPSWVRSIRFRLAFTYSILVFALAAVVIAVLNLALSQALAEEPVSQGTQFTSFRSPDGSVVTIERQVRFQFVSLERLVNERALENLQQISIAVLIGMFPASVAIGWFVADRALRPIGKIAGVAGDIQRTDDLSRRIDLEGPEDELRELAETFDEMLERIESGVGAQRAFVQDISHELRNPLAVMATNLDIVLNDDDASIDDYRQAAEIVRSTVDRTARTVDDLVIFARDEVPHSKRVAVDLMGLVDEVLAEYQGPIEANRLRIQRVAQGAIVSADRDGLKRAVGNIVSNAVRLSRSGTTVRCGAGTRNGWAWVGVDDQGPGIDPRDHEQAFQRFWSNDSRAIGGEQRSGLGLAIARQVAESHGGLVTLQSELGAGAEFVIWLPTVPDADKAEVSTDGVHPIASPLSEVGQPISDTRLTHDS